MNLNLDIKITKRDIVTIVLLSVVFFSIAVVNLGLTQSPTTTAQLTAGQSFYLDLGSSTNVKSMILLLKQGAMNVTISSGSPGNWQNNSVNSLWPSATSEDYYKWHEVSIGQTTQYLEVNFSQAGSFNTIIAEIAVIDQNNKQVTIKSLNDLGSGNPNLHNLIDEQNMVQYPSDYMQNTYFDEIYFVRTAEQYVQHSSSIYEWTHPPLGKLIQASSLIIFGFNPFGWRIMGVIFATLMIPLIYLFGKKMFGTWIGGFTAAFLLTFDFMHFTMGRMGTADTYVVFFSLASQLFFFIYIKNVLDKGWKTSVIPLFFAFFFFALGFSSKWLVLFGFVGELALLVVLRLNEVRKIKSNLSSKVYAFLDHPYSVIVAFILMAIGIYFLTYIPDMLAGRSFFDVINLQGQMYIYQSTLTATHPFASPWYSWPFLIDPVNAIKNMLSSAPQSSLNWVHVPVWLQSASMSGGLNSTIVVMGNPAIWWVGFAAILGITVFYVPKIFRKTFSLKKYLPAIFLVVVFFFQWLPYILISRVVFIYHFYSNVPIICLGTAFVVSKYWSNRWAKIAAIAYFALTIALFVLFYPVISGVPTTTSNINSLRWFVS
ncbi:MAG TPA: glycosyltransferase family 39 protein, partial [Candidatus Acidoferrum sp.]|nr:glycosyltransferase family 39 protein [Candidatus Acidoferrum sp.]